MNWRRVLIGESLWRTLVRALVVAGSAVTLSQTVLVPVRTRGISMLPAYHGGELLLFNRLAYRWSEPARGDIAAITFRPGVAVLVKRIVALPGERVRIDTGVVHIDGKPLDEAYVENRRPWEFDEIELSPNEYFVIGDNRGMPMRNHTMGPIPRGRLFGRLLF